MPVEKGNGKVVMSDMNTAVKNVMKRISEINLLLREECVALMVFTFEVRIK